MISVAYKPPDLHAPRSRDKLLDFLAYPAKDPYGFFDRMKQQHPQLEKYSNKQIAGWILVYNKQMAQEVASSRYGVKLPEGLGAVVTGLSEPTEKTASYNIDYATSKRLGMEVTYRNSHTDGYVAKIYYTNNIPGCKFTGHHLWSFKPVRALSRAVSAIMKDEANWKRYIVFTKRFPVAALFNKHWMNKSTRKKVKEQEARAKMLAEYDEFSFD